MKATLATLTVSLLAVSAYAQSCDDVADKFLANIKYNYSYFYYPYDGTATLVPVTTGTNVIAPSITPFGVCDEIWRVAGSCCNSTTMKSTYNTRMDTIKDEWNNFIKRARDVKDLLSKLKAMSANRETVKANLTTANTLSSATFEGLTPEQGTVLIEKIKQFSVQVEEFALEAKACFNELIKARGVAFCYGCSANAANKVYFRADDGKFTISQASRNAIAAVCIKPWVFINGFGGMIQMFSILNYQRDPSTSSYPKRTKGPGYAGVTSPQLYDAFIACPNATVGGTCTQAIIDQIVVSQFNLFYAEKYAEYPRFLNIYNITSSYASRLLAIADIATGDIDIGATPSDGADLTIAVTRPPYTVTINTTSITPQAPVASPDRSTSSGNIFVVTSIIMAAVVLTLN